MQRNISNLQNSCTARKNHDGLPFPGPAILETGCCIPVGHPCSFFVLSGYFTKESGQTLVSIASKA
ncbi:hypothetical protein DYJ25_09375 [Prevotella denticola]|nr:hypothetical protein DYJ25_09375 [Prevotella denticola]